VWITGGEKMKATAQASLRVRRNFAATHLRAAAAAALQTHQVEQNNDTSKFGDWYSQVMQSVPVSIVMAGAALEAGANELVQDILDRSTPLVPGLGATLQLKDLKSDRSGNSLGKYRRVAWLFDKKPEEGKQPWQNAATLVMARNALMHFRPIWDQVEVGRADSDLVQALKTAVAIAAPFKSPLTFPHSFMTYGCAKWAVDSVLGLSKHISNLLGVKDQFDLFGANFALP
jgi:hypothetical protein